MKKLLCLLLTIFLLAGCQAQPEPTTEPTEPSVPTLAETGKAWDESGALLQIPLDVPDLWQYTSIVDYNGDILLWGRDTHREGQEKIMLCLLDAETGDILATNEVEAKYYQEPQPLGEALYLCDSENGQVLELDKGLQIRHLWEAKADYGSWYMGTDTTLYRFGDGTTLSTTNLTTNQTNNLVENASGLMVLSADGSQLTLEYTNDDTAEHIYACLDLTDGTLSTPPFEEDIITLSRLGDTWLCGLERDSDVYYLGSDNQPLRVEREKKTLRLLEDGHILETDYYYNINAKLYDLEGKFLSGCTLSDTGEYFLNYNMVWSESQGGYFLLLDNYDSGRRLLFWDISKGTEGEDLAFEPLPPESEQMQQLRQQADALEEEYGVQILLGDRCQTEFIDFTAERTEDYEAIRTELYELETALSSYPEGFFRQLRYYSVRGVQIQLVGQLTPLDGFGRENGSYAAFTYIGENQFEIVSNVYATTTESYYHEFSHNIDNHLEYIASTTEETQYSEDEWMTLNPEWFEYSYDYQSEFEPIPEGCEDYFLDSYSTIKPTEDRAQIMEQAMMAYSGWMFEEYPRLYDKLEYYCRCIRESFDTTGWPETTLWEQHLK